MSPVSDLITKIHHLGTNVLGMFLMAASVGLGCLAVFNAEVLPKPILMVILTSSMCVPIAFDFIWRYYAEPRSSAWRMIFPGSGGSVLFFPAWLMYLVMFIGVFSTVTLAALKLI